MASSSAPTVESTGAAPSEALQQLGRGELTLEQYLDAVVERNVAHIQAHVSAARLAEIKQVLREALVTSPALVEVVQRLTGREPRLEDELT